MRSLRGGDNVAQRIERSQRVKKGEGEVQRGDEH